MNELASSDTIELDEVAAGAPHAPLGGPDTGAEAGGAPQPVDMLDPEAGASEPHDDDAPLDASEAKSATPSDAPEPNTLDGAGGIEDAGAPAPPP